MRNFSYKSLLLIFFLTIPEIIIFESCKKDKDEIPSVYVNFYININSTQYIELNSVGGWVYLTGGSRGIIVYRLSMDEFVALERHCPYQPENSCGIVEVESSGMTLIDSCCGSTFIIIDGSLVSGPATRSLKYYNTSYNGSTLHIYN